MEGMIAQKSLRWILPPLFIAIIFIIICILIVALVFLGITIFFLIFFRDPERIPGDGIVAPADGKITYIGSDQDEMKITIVMGLKNVHVNRMPFEGKVISIEHILGKHVPAFNKDAEANERVIYVINTKIGKIKIIQIAGAFARRIQPYVNKGDMVLKGHRIGIIRFGSRVDLYLPKERVKILVETGQKVKAAEITLAKVK
jgi:phosphatidylserine decarboxylase